MKFGERYGDDLVLSLADGDACGVALEEIAWDGALAVCAHPEAGGTLKAGGRGE